MARSWQSHDKINGKILLKSWQDLVKVMAKILQNHGKITQNNTSTSILTIFHLIFVSCSIAIYNYDTCSDELGVLQDVEIGYLQVLNKKENQ